MIEVHRLQKRSKMVAVQRLINDRPVEVLPKRRRISALV